MVKKLSLFASIVMLSFCNNIQGQIKQGEWGGHFDFRLGGVPTSAMVDILWNSVLKNRECCGFR